MLILTRKQSESLVVSIDGIKLAEIKYVKIRSSGKADFGITAPDHVRVDRAEVFERMSRATAGGGSEATGNANDSQARV